MTIDNDLNLSMILTPYSTYNLDLKQLVDKLKNNNQFSVNFKIEYFLVEFFNSEDYTKVLLYSNGTVNYIESIYHEEFSSDGVYIAFKNCKKFLNYLNIDIKYAKNVGVFISGNIANDSIYKQSIVKFGKTIFKTPRYRDINLLDSSHYSVLIEEKLYLDF